MLQIKKISKKYITGDLHQTALDQVSLNLRDNEFVAILGPSGSGKTTLLNIIGGLDRYDSGDLIINGISTKKYKDRDWDSYRNHTIGFVFQSYNLIPHQSILANVELALTISGISRKERRNRAKKALEEVGLGDQIHKKPNQMSGGQMQRVAIARALVNNPDILLADEPTGALDTETSVQVMELLKEVAKDRLVVMVTHNPELAEEYATRIVRVRDGHILDDTDPYYVDDTHLAIPEHKNMGHASMSFLTALSLSFNNLRTKKARTLLTSFAGSIGIIGIALILSLSTGVNTYIEDIQKSTMTSYPISIEAQSLNLGSVLSTRREAAFGEVEHELDGIYSNSLNIEMASNVSMSMTENNLTEFMKYLDDENSEIHQYIGENGVIYSYDVSFDVFTYDTENVLVNTDGVVIESSTTTGASSMMSSMTGSVGSVMGNIRGGDSGDFSEMLPGKDDTLVSSALTDSYEIVYGSWPQSYDEVVLALDSNNEISLTTLYEFGMLPSAEYTELMKQLENGEKVEPETVKWNYSDVEGMTFYLLPACDQYEKNENGLWSYIGNDAEKIADMTDDMVKLKVVGVVRPDAESQSVSISGNIGYTKALTDYIISHTYDSEIVKEQKEQAETNILNGLAFAPSDDEAKAADAAAYLSALNVSEKAELGSKILKSVYGNDAEMTERIAKMSEAELASTLDGYLAGDTDTDMLVTIYDSYISTGSYEDNMTAFGVVSTDAPASISIYADSFEAKDSISDCIDNYNKTADEENQISYTDYVGLLMSSVTTIIDVISYVLIAFVAVSLVVSSIMIGIITYISVLERTKEIGILRAIGASKKNISQVFNAETFIIGLCSGLIGIGVTLLSLIPGNVLIHAIAGTTEVNAQLPVTSALILIMLSVILTLIGGLIPAKKAAKKDPVTALRTE